MECPLMQVLLFGLIQNRVSVIWQISFPDDVTSVSRNMVVLSRQLNFLSQNRIVEAMRMHQGHICTAVSPPSPQQHRFSTLDFMYCRTKCISPFLQRTCVFFFVLNVMTVWFPWRHRYTQCLSLSSCSISLAEERAID